MPGSSLHIAIADHVADYLQDLNKWNSGTQLPNFKGPTPKELAALAKKHPSYFAFGAIGPDFFALLPDFRAECVLGRRVPIANSLVGIVDFVFEFYEALDPFIEKYERSP